MHRLTPSPLRMRLALITAFVVGLGAVAILVPPASAQLAPPPPVRISMLTVGLLYADNKPLHEELKLSDEQVKKLTEHRDRWFRSYYSSAPPVRAVSTPDRSKDNDKALADILKPNQLKRFHQLTLQAVEKQYGGRALRYLEIADALKLTADQQDKLRTGKPEDVLTKEQQGQWQAMLGEPFKGALLASRGGYFPGGGRGSIPRPPQYLTYVGLRAIQDELKLSDEQRSKAREWRRQWNKANEPFPQFSSEQLNKAKETAKEIDDAVTKLLKPEQMTRLKQIALQDGLSLGSPDNLFTRPDVVTEVEITAEQIEKINELRDKRHAAQGDLYLTGESSTAIAKKVEAFRRDTHEQLTNLLTEEQQRRLKEVIGKPFARHADRRIPLGGRGTFPRGSAASSSSFSLTVFGLSYAEDKAFIDELKLSEMQAKKLAELERKFLAEVSTLRPPSGSPGRPTPAPDAAQAQKIQELNDRTAKAADDVLQPEQQKRLKQLALQMMTGPGAGPLGDGFTVARSLEVGQALNLTADQKEDLFDGDELMDVLTTEQKEKWKELLGEPFKGEINRLAGPRSSPRGGQVPEALNYLGQAAVRNRELKLTDDQQNKLQEAFKRWTDFTKDFTNLPTPEYLKKADEYQKKLEEANRTAPAGAGQALAANPLAGGSQAGTGIAPRVAGRANGVGVDRRPED
jgi:hypothetical protein